MAKATKPGPIDKAEIMRIVELVTQALMDGDKTKEARIELVIKMLIHRVRPGKICSTISQAFGVKFETVRKDIEEARDIYVSWYNKQAEKALKAESAATMDEAIAMGFEKKDVQGVVAAQKHKDTLHRLIKDEDAPAAKLGVVMLPSRKDIKSWSEQFQKPSKPKK